MRKLRRLLSTALALVLAPASAGAEDPSILLRRAELVHNPVLGIEMAVELEVRSKPTGTPLRSSRFLLLTRRGGRTLLVISPDDPSTLGAALITDDTYQLLMPRSDRAVELPFDRVVSRDLSHAGFLRFDLRSRYAPRLDGHERIGDRECRRLLLEPKNEAEPFARVRYWIDPEGDLPRRIEFFDQESSPLKTVRFVEYQSTGFGLRPARIEIEDRATPDEVAVLRLAPPVGIPTSRLAFDLDELKHARDLALRHRVETGSPISGRRLVADLSRRRADRGRPEPKAIDP